MAAPLASPPPGFFTANDVLNRLPVALVTEMIQETLQVKWRSVGLVLAETYIERTGPGFQPKQIQSAINAVAYIFREALLHGLSHEALPEALEQSADLSPAVREQFASAWTAHSSQGKLALAGRSGGLPEDAEDADTAAEAAQDQKLRWALRLGRLERLDWKLGVRVSSGDCDSLGVPFVGLTLRIAEPGGRVRAVPLQLTLEEFRSLGGAFQDIVTQLDQA